MVRLGEEITAAPELFGAPARIGNLFDYFASQGSSVEAADIVVTLLKAFNKIWPGRTTLNGVPLGDCWYHSLIPGNGLVPFHKLTQWLAYSLFEPLEQGGLTIVNPDGMTALAEYRNGGLFLDTGVLEVCDATMLREPQDPTSEDIVEWRALTVALVDAIAPLVRKKLGKTTEEFPLASVLEGGTWAAGRKKAAELRKKGNPPIAIISDGTLF